MEFFEEEVQLGRLKIILSVLAKQGCSVYITAKDENNRKVWKTPLLNEDGEVGIYSDYQVALTEAKKKILSLPPDALEP